MSGVPQGVRPGAVALCCVYVSPVADVIKEHETEFHQYADDLQVYNAVRKDEFDDLSNLFQCVVDVTLVS